jgi:hypothetical protein
MKKLLPILFALIFSLNSKAQLTSIQAGPVVSFFGRDPIVDQNVNNYGGELIANYSINKTISAGAGFQLFKFSNQSNQSNLSARVFATLKASLASNKFVYFFHVDPGYDINHYYYSFIDKAGNGDFKFEYKHTGGFYLGTGAGVHLKTKASPYINLQYSMLRLKYLLRVTDIGQSQAYDYPDKGFMHGITITAGLWLNTRKK